MNAEYTTSLLYPGNPYVEALPPMLAGQELIRALASVPLYSTSDRDRSTGERLQLLSALYEFYQPLTMTLDLYCEVYNAMQHCYGQYTPQREAASLQQGYAAMQGKAVAASIGGGNSFSVVGVSGLGKSTALQRVLSLFPQIIHHERYNGQMLCCQQIPYLVVQTPHDGSVKAMILDIYLQLDALLGTSYQHYALAHKLTLDVLVSQLNQIVRINHVGLLVIDELQNIAYRKNGISKTQYLRLAEKSDTIRTWKHDTREAMNGALLLMQQGRTAEAELLLKDRLASMQVETIAIKSGNIIVDAILTQKIDECLDNGIVLDMKVETPSHIMREEDTCEVFGSILDFAVAVSNKQPTDKKIKIVLQDQDNKLKVFVTANAAVFDSVDATRMTEIEQSTTKILSAYNGIVSAQHDEDQSTITWNLLIPLPQDNEWLASYIYDSSEALSSGVRTVKQ